METMIEQCTRMMRTMGGMMDGGMMSGNMMGSMMGPMMLGSLLVWTLGVVGLVLLIRLLWTRTDPRHRAALAVLQERFARGEIDREEYQDRQSILRRR
jgi:putative membrane protein